MQLYSQLKSQKLGYYKFNDPAAFVHLEKFFKMRMIKLWNRTALYPILHYPIGIHYLRKTQKLLKELYMSDMQTQYGEVDAWRGIDQSTDVWHNDMPDGYNTAFLMYLCNTNTATGGGLQFRTKDAKYTEIVFPKKYDIIMLDQDLKYEHRVLPVFAPINRDIANIEFNIIEGSI